MNNSLNILNLLSKSKLLIIAWGILVGIAILLLYLFIGSIHENNRLSNNIDVYKDSVHTLALKNGQLLSERSSYELKEKELSEYLDISKNEVKDLKKKLESSLREIAKLKGQFHIDTIYTEIIKDSIIYRPDSTICVKFFYGGQWIQLDGMVETNKAVTTPAVTIYNVNVPIDLVVGWANNGKFFVTSPNPYVHFGKIDAAQLTQPKIKKWGVGVSGGWYVIYDPFKKDLRTGPGLGLSLQRSF